MNDNDRTTAVGLARYAKEYFDAAGAAHDAIRHQKRYEKFAPAPVMFLVAHSIELALKAYLRHQGLTVNDIKAIGHDLVECWRVATEHGIQDHIALTEEDLGILGLINDHHETLLLRYIETGSKRLPVFKPLLELAQKLLDAAGPVVGLDFEWVKPDFVPKA